MTHRFKVTKHRNAWNVLCCRAVWRQLQAGSSMPQSRQQESQSTTCQWCQALTVRGSKPCLAPEQHHRCPHCLRHFAWDPVERFQALPSPRANPEPRACRSVWLPSSAPASSTRPLPLQAASQFPVRAASPVHQHCRPTPCTPELHRQRRVPPVSRLRTYALRAPMLYPLMVRPDYTRHHAFVAGTPGFAKHTIGSTELAN